MFKRRPGSGTAHGSAAAKRSLYQPVAGEPVFVDMHSRHAPARLRQMAEEMARSRREK
jgi:hypothetical protein